MPRSLPIGEERRDLGLSDAGVSVAPGDSGAAQRFAGHAAVFNTRAAIGNPKTIGFYEQIAPGAFTKTLAESDVRMLIDHDMSKVVSRVSAGTLNLSQDVRGLATDSHLDTDLSYVSDLVANLRNGNITGMSFGFQVMQDDWTEEEMRDASGEPYRVELRTVREVKLIEVSAVTFPAYAETDAGLRYSLVPALRRRGDTDAIARAVAKHPELGPLLGYDPEMAPVHVYIDGNPVSSTIMSTTANTSRAMGHKPPRNDPDHDGDDHNSEGSGSHAKEPYGDVTYADPGYQSDGKKRYPIDTEEHVKAALSYINQADNASKYTAEQLAEIKARIHAAAKKFGIKVSDDGRSEEEPPEVTNTEPGETTRDQETSETDGSEPGETTRTGRQHRLAELRLKALKQRIDRLAS